MEKDIILLIILVIGFIISFYFLYSLNNDTFEMNKKIDNCYIYSHNYTRYNYNQFNETSRKEAEDRYIRDKAKTDLCLINLK